MSPIFSKLGIGQFCRSQTLFTGFVGAFEKSLGEKNNPEGSKRLAGDK